MPRPAKPSAALPGAIQPKAAAPRAPRVPKPCGENGARAPSIQPKMKVARAPRPAHGGTTVQQRPWTLPGVATAAAAIANPIVFGVPALVSWFASGSSAPSKSPPGPVKTPASKTPAGDTPNPQYDQIATNFKAKIAGSRHFTWHEALYLPSWKRHRTTNEVDATILANIVRQAKALDKVRDHFNASINVHCWLRPTAYNRHIGGAKNSAHLRGTATDFDVSGYSAEEVRQALIADKSIYPGAGELGVNWVHIDLEHHAWFHP